MFFNMLTVDAEMGVYRGERLEMIQTTTVELKLDYNVLKLMPLLNLYTQARTRTRVDRF